MSAVDKSPVSTEVGPAPRRQTRGVVCRWKDVSVQIGGGAPVVVQSMTNTDTADAIATAIQVKELAMAGSEIVRITVNTPEAAQEVPAIREQLDRMGVHVPLCGDFHFNGHKLLTQFPECAQALSKYRINPGNMGGGKRRDDNFAQMIEVACRWQKPVRIGVNWGSLDQNLLAKMMDENSQLPNPLEAQAVMREALVTSAIDNARRAEELGLPGDAIVLSCKVSHVQDLISVYRVLSSRCDYALHLGLTEAGMGSKGIVASTAALGVLLQEGIGDTIRISLTPEPGGDRTKEVVVAQEILQANPELNGFFCINDPSALGAVAALEIAKKSNVMVVGFDGQPEGKKAIREGKIYADPIQYPDKIGQITVQTIMSYLNGEDVQPQVLIPTGLYKKADAENDPEAK